MATTIYLSVAFLYFLCHLLVCANSENMKLYYKNAPVVFISYFAITLGLFSFSIYMILTGILTKCF